MWTLSGPAIKLVSPAVAGGLLTTVQPEKSPPYFFMYVFSTRMHVPWRQEACPSLSPHNCSFNLGSWQMGDMSRFMLTIQNIYVIFFLSICACVFLIFVSSFLAILSVTIKPHLFRETQLMLCVKLIPLLLLSHRCWRLIPNLEAQNTPLTWPQKLVGSRKSSALWIPTWDICPDH